MDRVKIFIIGAGKACQDVLAYLLPFSWIQIVGVADQNPDAPGMEMARASGIPVFVTDSIENLNTKEIDVVLELTGDREMGNRLLPLPGRKFCVATGDVIRLFFNTIHEVQEKNGLLKKHMEISLMIAQSKSVAQIFDTIVTGGMEITNMPVGSLALFDQEKEEFAIVSQKGLPPKLRQRERYPIRPGGLTQHILSSHQPTIISNLKESTSIDKSSLLDEGIASLVAIPLFSELDLLGILYYDDIHPRFYPPYLVDQLSQFATEAVIAIQKHKALAQIKQLSSRDPLTGLYNRSQLEIRLKEAILTAEKEDDILALMVCDLDHFKEVNEKFGHQYGDQVLKTIADCVSSAMEKEDPEESDPFIFRSGVDEVTVLFAQANQEKILHKAAKIRKAVRAASAATAFPLDISIGAALYPTECKTQDQLLTLASHSLLIAQKSDEKICIGAKRILNSSNSLYTLFEPIVDLDQNQVVGYEAISRDIGGKLSITDIFKQYAVLGELAELKNTCFIAQLEKAEALNLPRVFLNVDSSLLKQCGWVQKPPNIEVILEISESESLVDFEDYLKIAKKWREKGFKFAIDDFGAGFISLPFISKLNPDYIKIDRTVILQAVSSLPFRAFLKNIVGALQKDPATTIIAEGIENEEELQVTRETGIPLIQGFLMKDKGYPPISGPEKNTTGDPCPD